MRFAASSWLTKPLELTTAEQPALTFMHLEDIRDPPLNLRFEQQITVWIKSI